MSSDSESNSEAGNSLVKIMDDDDEVNNSKNEVSEIDEEDSAGEEEVNTSGASDRIGERHKEARLKERGARTNAILKQSSSEDQCDASEEENGDEGDIENGDDGDIENGDSGSEYETRQRKGDDKQSDVGVGLDSSKRRSRKKPAKYLDDDFDEFDSSEDERVNKKSKKSKYDDDDEEYQPAKEELDRYSRRARKQVMITNILSVASCCNYYPRSILTTPCSLTPMLRLETIIRIGQAIGNQVPILLSAEAQII